MEYIYQSDFEANANGNCPDCGTPTIDGDAYSCCYYGAVECTSCGHAICDGSC
jgi:hypothetical protein